jgi:hypothetical protein
MKTAGWLTGLSFISVVFISGCAPEVEHAQPKHSICLQYSKNQPVAVLGHSPQLEGEWYADWFYQLNQFAANHPEITIVPSSEIDTLNVPDYTLIMAKRGYDEFWLQEAVETPYYDFVVATYADAPIEGVLQHFTLEPAPNQLISDYCQ